MTARTRVLAALLVVLVVALVAQRFVFHRAVDARPAAVTRVQASRPKFDMDPEQPRPDRRVELAMRSLWALGGHRDSLGFDWRFADGRWRLSVNGKDAGSVSAYPDFAELRGLVTPIARELAAAPVAAAGSGAGDGTRTAAYTPSGAGDDLAAAVQKLDALRPLEALEVANRAWLAGRRDDAVLRLAERALLELHLATNDQVGAADPILGRALAVASMRAAADSLAWAEDDCLLESRLGYEAEACAHAERLAEDSPIRAFVLHDDDRLAALARGSRSAFPSYLRLVRYADEHDLQGWEAWRRARLASRDLPVAPFLSSELALGEFGDAASSGVQLSMALAEQLGLERRPEVPQALERGEGVLGGVMDAFEGSIATHAAGTASGLLDTALVRSYCRSVFYSGLYGVGVFLRDRYSSIEATQSFADELGEPNTPVAAEFAAWYRHLADAKAGSEDVQVLKRDLMGMRFFGEPMLVRTWWVLAGLSSPTSITTRVAARAMDRKLDTRPSSLWVLGSVHGWPSYDLAVSEEMLGAAVPNMHPAEGWRRASWYAYTGDSTALVSLLADPRLGGDHRSDVLESLAKVGGESSPGVERAFREALARDPGNFDVVSAYADHCLALDRPADAKTALERWRVRPDRTRRSFDDVNALIGISRARQALGDLPGAFTAAHEAAKSGKNSALGREVEVLEALGREDEALGMAVGALQRYPDSPASLNRVVRLMWRRGDGEKVADLLEGMPFPVSGDTWRWQLGVSFAECFARHPEDGLRAAEALAARGPDLGRHLHSLALAVRDSGNFTLAAELYDHMPVRGQERLYAGVHACEMLRRAGRSGEILPRLRSLAGPGGSQVWSMLAAFAFSEGYDEVLWQMPAPKQHDGDTEYFWLMRAASVVSRPSQPAERRAEVERHLADREWTGRYSTLGRYLLGHADEATIAAEAQDARDWNEVYYYEGILEQSRSNYTGAARDYARSIATGQRLSAEYTWSVSRLMTWASRGMSLPRLAAEDRAAAASDS